MRRDIHAKIASLKTKTDAYLRHLKFQYAYAKGETWEHRIYTAIDRILLQREGIIPK